MWKCQNNILNRLDVTLRNSGGQWSVVSGQWSVVSGQWSVVSGQWSVVSDQWLTAENN